MRESPNSTRMLRNLRFALGVLEERSHIGLDDKTAEAVRNRLLRQILAIEAASVFPPSAQEEESGAEEINLINRASSQTSRDTEMSFLPRNGQQRFA